MPYLPYPDATVCEESGKQRYESEKDARAALLINWKGRSEFDLRSFYECTHCQGFHLTKQLPGGTNRI
jgi:hypothetical protein